MTLVFSVLLIICLLPLACQFYFFFFQAEDGIRDDLVTGVQTCALPISRLDDVLELLPGPDFPGGGQVISPAEEIRQAYETGRGSLVLKCKWETEQLARGQWRGGGNKFPHPASSK